MQFFLFPWLTLELTNSVSQVGVVAFLQGVTMLTALMFGGVIIDRMDRRKVLAASEFLLMANVGVLATLTITDSVQIWHVYIASAVGGVFKAPTFPARVAIMGDVVEREDITNAVALNMLLINMSWVVGAPLAGALIASVGMGTTLYINGAIFLAGALPILFIHYVPSLGAERAASVWRDLVEGLRFVKSSRLMVSLFTLVLLIAFFAGPYSQLLPAFGKDVLELDALKAGLLLLMVGSGAFTANLVLAGLKKNEHTVRLFLGAVLLFIVSLFLFAITPWFGLSLGLLFLAGMGEFAFIALGTAILLLTVPSAFMGRVQSMWTMGGSILFIGALPMGLVGEAWGLRAALAVGAAICFLVWLVVGILLPSMRRTVVR